MYTILVTFYTLTPVPVLARSFDTESAQADLETVVNVSGINKVLII